jgi:hypothetical protein
MGDALLMPNNYKGILESISSETETGPKTLMIRFFYSGKDEEVKVRRVLDGNQCNTLFF